MEHTSSALIIGRLLGTITIPLLIAWLMILGYEKIKKRRVSRRPLKIILLGIVLFVASTISRFG